MYGLSFMSSSSFHPFCHFFDLLFLHLLWFWFFLRDPFSLWVWLWANIEFTCPFLHKVLSIGNSLHCFWCWGFLPFSNHLLFFRSDHSRPCSFGWCSLRVQVRWSRLGSLIVGLFGLFVLLGVGLSVLGPLVCSSVIFTWGFLVLGTLSTTLWLKYKLPSSCLVLYFIISVLGSLLFCISSGVLHSSRLCSCLGLLLLLGYRPFQFWVFSVLVHLDLFSLFLFLGPIKFGYLFLLLSRLSEFWWLAALPFSFGVIIMYSTSSFGLILYSSGSIHIVLLFFIDSSFFVLFYSIYLCSLFSATASSLLLLSGFCGMLFLIGIPPLGMFWAKLAALLVFPFTGTLLLFLVSLLTLVPYTYTALSFRTAVHSSMSVLSLLVILPVALFAFFVLMVL